MLLVLLGALGATVLVMRAGDRVEAIAITERVPQGQVVPESAIKSVLVAEDSDIKYVRWDQRSLLKEYRAGTDLVGGTVLVGTMLSKGKGIPAGKAVVGLSLKAGQYPARIEEGDTVMAIRVGDKASGNSDSGSGSGNGGSGQDSTAGDSVITANAKVQSIKKSSDDSSFGGDLPVSVIVNKEDVADLTSAASNGEVSIVLGSSAGS